MTLTLSAHANAQRDAKFHFTRIKIGVSGTAWSKAFGQSETQVGPAWRPAWLAFRGARLVGRPTSGLTSTKSGRDEKHHVGPPPVTTQTGFSFKLP